MKIFFSKTQDAGAISNSCAQSINDWNWLKIPQGEKVFEDEKVICFSDNSPDKWNGRYGIVVKSKIDNTSYTMHFTGMGFGWGKIQGEIEGNLLIIPTGLDVDGRTVYDLVKNNVEWCEFSHSLFYGLGEGFEYHQIPMVPFTVG